MELFHRLYETYGPQHWWPGADDSWEVIVGAILTQNTAWANVDRALGKLKRADVLSPRRIRELPETALAQLIRSSGYFNTKARKLKAFAQHVGDHYGDELPAMFAREPGELREELLSIHGVGEETADDILVYAAGVPSFVIDTYTRRLLTRLGLTPEKDSYASFQALFHEHLPRDVGLFNEYHALLDKHAKDVCKRRPLCDACCLLAVCPTGRLAMQQYSGNIQARKPAKCLEKDQRVL